FNEKGLLVPNQPILSDLDEIRKVFTEEIASPRRTELFENYLRYLEDLKAVIGENFYQWLNGSFATKKPEPRDIDLVTFIHWKQLDKFEKELKAFRPPESLNKYGVDAYFIPVFEEGHRHRAFFEGDRAKWWEQFESTRLIIGGKMLKKGFLEIHFENGR
ncbi:MAG: hypothetical protein AAB316_03055, partial [Bacteroidota bacterium]